MLTSPPADFEDGWERRAFRNAEDFAHSLGSDGGVVLKEAFVVVGLVRKHVQRASRTRFWTFSSTERDLSLLLFLPGFGAALARGGSLGSAPPAAAPRGLLQDEPSLCPVLRLNHFHRSRGEQARFQGEDRDSCRAGPWQIRFIILPLY